jgi:hypothetical protein
MNVLGKAQEYMQSLIVYKQQLEQNLAFVNRQIQTVSEATSQFGSSENEGDEDVQS